MGRRQKYSAAGGYTGKSSYNKVDPFVGMGAPPGLQHPGQAAAVAAAAGVWAPLPPGPCGGMEAKISNALQAPALWPGVQDLQPHPCAGLGIGGVGLPTTVSADQPMLMAGKVKHVFRQSGFAFVESEQLKVQGLQDAYLAVADLGSFKMGSEVLFAVRFNRQGQPQAKDLVGTHDLRGRIKSMDTGKRFGFIACDWLKQRGCENDVFFPEVLFESFHTGDLVSFTLRFNAQGLPQAMALRALPGEEQEPQKVTKQAQEPDLKSQVLQGRVKSMNDAKGFGFIECKELQEQGLTQDVFLHKSQFGNSQVDSWVTFTVRLNDRGQPQAADVTEVSRPPPPPVLSKAPPATRAVPTTPSPPAAAPVPRQEHVDLTATVKSFNKNTGFGFLDCEVLRKEGVTRDVFLHQGQLRQPGTLPERGSTVQFSVIFNERGEPQATDCRPAPEDPDTVARREKCFLVQ